MQTIRKILSSNLLSPAILTIMCALCGALYAQQNKIIESKAAKVELKEACKKLDQKVDNATLVQMIRVLEMKDSSQDQRLDQHEVLLREHGHIQYEQLKVLQKIQIEMQQMNGTDNDASE